MKKIEIRTRKKNTGNHTYIKNIENLIVFLRHDEDKILVKNAEQICIEIYDNGKCIFCGSKNELFEKLKN